MLGQSHSDLSNLSLLFIYWVTLSIITWVYLYRSGAKLDFCLTPNPIRDHGNVVMCPSSMFYSCPRQTPPHSKHNSSISYNRLRNGCCCGKCTESSVSSDSLPVATGKLPLSWVVVQTLALPTEEDCLVPDPASCPQFSVCLGEAV